MTKRQGAAAVLCPTHATGSVGGAVSYEDFKVRRKAGHRRRPGMDLYKEDAMSRCFRNSRHSARGRLATIALLSGVALLATAVEAAAQEQSKPASATPSRQEHFATPQAAVDAMLEAFKANDDGALLDIFGHDDQPLVVVPEDVEEGAVVVALEGREHCVHGRLRRCKVLLAAWGRRRRLRLLLGRRFHGGTQ